MGVAGPQRTARAPALRGSCGCHYRARLKVAGLDARCSAAEPADHDRIEPHRCRAVAKLPVAVQTPARHVARGGARAGMGRARRQFHGRPGQPLDIHGREAVGGGAVAELAGVVGAPALHSTAGNDRATVRAWRGLDRDDTGGQAEHVGGRAAERRRRPVTELAGAVGAPALRAAGIGDDASVPAPLAQSARRR